MIKYIEGKEIMTRREAKHKYKDISMSFMLGTDVLEGYEISSVFIK